MEKILNYINGELVEPINGNYLDNYNPSNGQIYSLIPDSEKSDIDNAVAAAKEAFKTWGKTTKKERSNLLMKLADKIEEYSEELINTLNKKEAAKVTNEFTKKEIVKPYLYLKKLNIKKNSKEFKIFQNFFEIQEIKEAARKKDLEVYKIKDTHIEDEEISPFYPLFKHQIDACAGCLNFLKSEYFVIVLNNNFHNY